MLLGSLTLSEAHRAVYDGRISHQSKYKMHLLLPAMILGLDISMLLLKLFQVDGSIYNAKARRITVVAVTRVSRASCDTHADGDCDGLTPSSRL